MKLRLILAVALAAAVASLPGLSLSAVPTTGTVSVTDLMKDALRERFAEYQPIVDSFRKKASDEIDKLQKWEYRVVEVKGSDTVNLTMVMNKWGDEGWECFHVVSAAPVQAGGYPAGHLLFFRKRLGSWLYQLPLRDVMQVLKFLTIDIDPSGP